LRRSPPSSAIYVGLTIATTRTNPRVTVGTHAEGEVATMRVDEVLIDYRRTAFAMLLLAVCEWNTLAARPTNDAEDTKTMDDLRAALEAQLRSAAELLRDGTVGHLRLGSRGACGSHSQIRLGCPMANDQPGVKPHERSCLHHLLLIRTLSGFFLFQFP